MLVVRRKQPAARGLAAAAAPLAAVVELADHARRAHAFLPVVELFLDLVLDELALLLDHQDFLQAFGEAPRALRLERPGHRDLVDPQADCLGSFFFDTQICQRLHDIAVRFSGRDDAQPRFWRIENNAVQPVRARIGERGVDLPVENARFLLEDAVGPADVQAVGWQDEVLRGFDFDPRWVNYDRCSRLDHVSDALERDPAARVAAHRKTVQAEIQVVLHAGRVEHRDQARLEDVLRLVRQRRRLGAVIVAGEDQHAAVARSARRIGVLEDITAAIDPRSLAVPHGEDAVVLRAREEIELLRAPDRGRREVLVQARLEADVAALEVLPRAPQRLVEAAERGAAITGYEAGGVQPGAQVSFALQHHQADERLHAGEEDAAAFDGVLVLEAGLGEISAHDALALMRGLGDLCPGRSQYGSGPKDSARNSMNARVFAGRWRR